MSYGNDERYAACSIHLKNCNSGCKCSNPHHSSSHRMDLIGVSLFFIAAGNLHNASLKKIWVYNLIRKESKIHQYNTFKMFNLSSTFTSHKSIFSILPIDLVLYELSKHRYDLLQKMISQKIFFSFLQEHLINWSQSLYYKVCKKKTKSNIWVAKPSYRVYEEG